MAMSSQKNLSSLGATKIRVICRPNREQKLIQTGKISQLQKRKVMPVTIVLSTQKNFITPSNKENLNTKFLNIVGILPENSRNSPVDLQSQKDSTRKRRKKNIFY